MTELQSQYSTKQAMKNLHNTKTSFMKFTRNNTRPFKSHLDTFKHELRPILVYPFKNTYRPVDEFFWCQYSSTWH